VNEHQSNAEPVADVEMRIVALPWHLSAVRAVAADLAMRADFDLDAISDLRMAVDEACSALISRAVEGEVLVCRFDVRPEQIHFSAQVPTTSTAAPSRESFGWRVLTALADSVNTWVTTGESAHHVLRVDLVKKRLGKVPQ